MAARNRTTPSTRTELKSPVADHRGSVNIVEKVCELAGSRHLLNVGDNPARNRLSQAIDGHDTPFLFDWLVRLFSFQGISDRVASSYIDRHGSARWRDVHSSLSKRTRCSRLSTYWQFYGCGYDKMRQTCAEPTLFGRCPLPRHRLRNGRLNQTAYSLFLFIRDVAEGDLVGWLDKQCQNHTPNLPSAVAHWTEAIVGPLRNVFGVSDKVVAMALSDLLLAAPETRAGWHELGFSLVAIDTLVHNFLCRTGIANSAGHIHAYGPNCYKENGCAQIIREISAKIDARRFNAIYPEYFPRFVQHAIWRFCSAEAFDVCNGNRIDDSRRCQNTSCQLFEGCKRLILKPKNDYISIT